MCLPEQPVAVICCSMGTPLAARSTRLPSVARSSAPEIATMQPCSRAICLPASSASALVGQGNRGKCSVGWVGEMEFQLVVQVVGWLESSGAVYALGGVAGTSQRHDL